MDDRVLDRLTLVTLFANRGIERYVSAYADVKVRLPGISYQNPIGFHESATVCIKPLRQATEDEVESVK